jgi:Na+/melibiose symporter-like transporter
MENQSTPRPPLSQIIIYAIGQFGWALASFGAGNLLLYFYLPPETGTEAVFPSYIYQGAILGIATVIGLVNFGGRIFDAITDPLIAGWSDRKQSKFGKRKSLMGLAAVPFALFSFLIFYPPSEIVGVTNTVWLVGTVFLFYLFFTMYLIPYNALISELGHHPKDRMLISTIISVAFALGFIVGGTAYGLQDVFAEGRTPTEAFQMAILIFAAVSLVLMLIPVFFLNENKYCEQSNTYIDAGQSLKSVFANNNFKWFAASDFTYWIALSFIQLGVSYYTVNIFGLETGMATQFLTLSFLSSFVLYIPINYLVKKFGKKSVLSIAFLFFGATFLMTSLTSILGLPQEIMFYSIAVASGFPLAAFGIVPNALIADIVHEHEEKTGQNLAGMFFGARTFMMKMGISVANLIFPSLLLLGKSADNPLGVQVTAFVALGFMILGWMLFSRYKGKVV